MRYEKQKNHTYKETFVQCDIFLSGKKGKILTGGIH